MVMGGLRGRQYVVNEGLENGKGKVSETVQRCGKHGSKEWKGQSGGGNSKDVVQEGTDNGKTGGEENTVKICGTGKNEEQKQ